jgi:hypothetical protein
MLGWLWSLLGWDEPRWTPEERALFREAALAEPGTKQAHLRLAALLEKNGNPLGTMVRLSFEVPDEPEDSPKHKQFEELESLHNCR